MGNTRLLLDIGTILIHVTFFTAVIFTPAVSTFWRWWKSDFGWTIVTKTAAIAGLLLPFEIHDWFGIPLTNPYLAWLRTIMFAAIPLVIIWRFVVLLTLQRLQPPPDKSARKAYKEYRATKKERKKFVATGMIELSDDSGPRGVITENMSLEESGTDGTDGTDGTRS